MFYQDVLEKPSNKSTHSQWSRSVNCSWSESGSDLDLIWATWAKTRCKPHLLPWYGHDKVMLCSTVLHTKAGPVEQPDHRCCTHGSRNHEEVLNTSFCLPSLSKNNDSVLNTHYFRANLPNLNNALFLFTRYCSKFQHHVPAAIGICIKGHKIEICYFHLILRFFPEYLGAEIRATTQLQQQQADVYELSEVVWWYQWLY